MLRCLSQTVSLIINSRAQSCKVDYNIQMYMITIIPLPVQCVHYTIFCGDKRTWNMQTQNYPDWKTNELKLPLRVVSTILFIHKSKLSGELLGLESQMDSFWSAKDAETSDGYFFIYLFGVFWLQIAVCFQYLFGLFRHY